MNKRKPPTPLPEAASPDNANGIPMNELEDNQCRWVIGSPSGNLCCGGAITTPRKSYCNKHLQGLNRTDTRWQSKVSADIDYQERNKKGRVGRNTGVNLV